MDKKKTYALATPLSVGLSSLAGAPCCTITDTEYLQISWGILHLIEYVQLTIPAGAFNRICPATEDWGILQFGVCPVPPRTGALYRLFVEYVQLFAVPKNILKE